MKRSVPLIIALLAMALPLSARAYVGISQGMVSTSLEVGYLTRSFEQNLSISLPLVYGDVGLPMAQATLVFRTQRFNPLVAGAGVAARLGWQGDVGSIVSAGFVISVGWEAFNGSEIVFAELAYLPFSTSIGTPIALLGQRQVEQWVRIGWRHLF